MGTERKPWKISPGDPSRPGVTGKGNRYNFAGSLQGHESSRCSNGYRKLSGIQHENPVRQLE